VLGEKQAQLMALLDEKERLLTDKDMLTREIDHRVKNSLQIVASFVQMQGRTTKDPAARAGFDETYGRIMSVARIHDSLWRSDDVGEVDIGQTIEILCRDLSGMAGERRTLDVTVAPDVKLPYQQALALSLIAVELVTNALKYAYAPEEPGVCKSRSGTGRKGRSASRSPTRGGGSPPTGPQGGARAGSG
jgi:two-component sensor histidine kinase